jgi:apolipoprotein N-acyltransferase
MQSAPLFLIPFAGVLLGIGFLFPIMWWCGFFGVALFLTFLLRARSLRQAGTIGGLVGVIWYFLVLAPTFLGVFPLDWFGIQNTWLQLFAIACTWFFAALVPAIGTIFFALAVYAFKQTNWKALIIVPSLWVISEWISASVVGFIGAGPSSLLGAHFTYGALGYLLANDSVLLQSASFGGIYALSFILVCIGTLVYVAVWQKEKRKVLLCGLSGLFLLWGAMHLLGFPGQDVSGVRPLSIAVISRYVAPELHPSAAESEVNFESVYQQIQLLRNIDVLVFPEDTAFLRDIQDSAHTVAMAHVFTLGIGSTSPLLIDTNDIRLDNGTLQSQVWYAKGMNDVVYGYKQMFMPFGEYMPYLYRFTLQSVGGTQLLNAITEVRGYAPGPVGGMGEIRGVRVAARFCDEVFSPTLSIETRFFLVRMYW